MATKNFNDDFMSTVLAEEAWENISDNFAWTEQLLEKYKDKVVWTAIAKNRNIVWSIPMIEKFKSRIDWDNLSNSDNEHLFTAENLERYKDRWNWHELSGNSSVTLTHEMLEKFADLWDWKEIIDRWNDDNIHFNADFLNRYRDHIPASALQNSRLWRKLVEDEEKKIIARILGQ